MSDDSNPTGQNPESGAKPTAHDDLKARLGLNLTDKKPAAPAAPAAQPAAAPAPASTSAPSSSVQASAIEEPAEGARKMSGLMILAIIGVAVGALLIGGVVGMASSTRKLASYQVQEASHQLEYIKTTPVASASGDTVMDVVTSHVEDSRRILDIMNKADSNDRESVSKARTELTAYIERAKKYCAVAPVYTVQGAFKKVVFNADMSYDVLALVDAVKRLYDETCILAYEGLTLDQVTAMEKPDAKTSVMLIRPLTKDNGERWNSGSWVTLVSNEPLDKEAAEIEYGVKDMVSGDLFRAPTTSLVEFQMGPVAMLESEVYKAAIFSRVQARMANLVKTTDDIDFNGLIEKLTEKGGKVE